MHDSDDGSRYPECGQSGEYRFDASFQALIHASIFGLSK
jgi:hypothetical protein